MQSKPRKSAGPYELRGRAERPVAVVVGVGALRGLGAALCERLAREDYHILIAGRTEGRIGEVAALINQGPSGSAEPVVTDAMNPADVERLFVRATTLGAGYAMPDLVIFNAGNNRRMDFSQVTPTMFEEFWRVCCFAGFLVGQAASRNLAPLGRGTILFTGASASLRGKPGFAHFSAAKAGLRMLCQAMAREFGPQGIHVAHIVVDGIIDGERFRTGQPEAAAKKSKDEMLNIDAIAESYWQLHRQPPSAWTQELDLRPFNEYF